MVGSYGRYVAGAVGLALVLPPSMIPASAEPDREPGRTPPPALRTEEEKKAPALRQGTVDLRILGVKDLHGNLEPSGEGDRKEGGVAYLDAPLGGRERAYPGRTIRIHAGDMVGASSPSSRPTTATSRRSGP